MPVSDTCANTAAVARFRARFRRQDQLFLVLNRILGIFVRCRKNEVHGTPRRILVANAGHLGDVVISTALLPVLKSAYPGAEIDFLTGSYSREAIGRHPLVDEVFLLDHWRSDRSGRPLLIRVARYYARLFSFCRELRARRHDLALDLHAWHPNYILLFWLAGIPVRAGFGRVGYEATLTHPVPFRYDRRHELEHQLDVARTLGIGDEHLRLAKPNLEDVSFEAAAKARSLLNLSPGRTRYRVLHPAASTAARDWTVEGWIALASRLAASGVSPVMTGIGARAAAIASEVCKREPKTISLVDRASWPELMAVLHGAELVYSVETAIGHAASALGRRVVAIYGGMDDPLRWAPLGSVVATHPVPCSPCFMKEGCASRDCLLRLSAAEVQTIADDAFRKVDQDRPEPLKRGAIRNDMTVHYL